MLGVDTVAVFIQILVLAGIGKLAMFLWKKAPYQGYIARLPRVGKFFKELFACELCLGVWIYWLLGFIWQMNFMGVTLPVLSEFLDGIVISFIVWVFSAGWQTLFQNFVITGSDDDRTKIS